MNLKIHLENKENVNSINVMTISASETYQHLVKKLRGSHLHFHLSETPFSAQILLRKRFWKGESGPASEFYHDEVSSKIVEKKEEKSSDIIEILKTKLAAAEAQALKAFQEKKIEINALKNALKNSENEIVNIRKALEVKDKDLKEKEKMIKKLEHKNENMNNNNRDLKSELAKAKNEYKKVQKAKSSNAILAPVLTVKPHVSNQSSLTEDGNQNSFLSNSYQSPSRTPPGTPPCFKTPKSSPVSNLLCRDAVTAPNRDSTHESDTFDCLICDKTFPSAELLRVHTEKHHDLKLCSVKLTDHEEKNSFIRYFKSMELTADYIENRKKHYPNNWDEVVDRIKFRKLAQLKLQNTSKQIEERIEKTDFKSAIFCGRSYDEMFTAN